MVMIIKFQEVIKHILARLFCRFLLLVLRVIFLNAFLAQNFPTASIERTGYAICTWTLPTLEYLIYTWANTAFCLAVHHHHHQ